MNKVYFLAILFIGLSFSLAAQEHHKEHQEGTHHEKPSTDKHHEQEKTKHFRVGFGMFHTYIGTTTTEGEQTIIVPSVGLDIEYWINHHWGLGFHNDLEIESFIIEENHEETIIKEYPTLVTFDALWHPWKGLVLVAGFGIEFERQENLQVARLGLEYEIEFGHHWDVFPTVFYDSRKDAHNTFSVGLGIGKRF